MPDSGWGTPGCLGTEEACTMREIAGFPWRSTCVVAMVGTLFFDRRNYQVCTCTEARLVV